MSLLSGLMRAALPVGSPRRDRILAGARKAGLLPAPVESSYQRWQKSFEQQPVFSDADIAGLRSADIRLTLFVESGRADPAAITRTLVSLTNQTFQKWSAVLTEDPSAPQSIKQLIGDARLAESRFVGPANTSDSTRSDATYSVHIRFGDALSPNALMSIAIAAVNNPNADVVSAEFDMIDPFSGLRSAPVAVGSWEPDLAEQFDLSAGFFARRAGTTHSKSSVHIGSVLLHRLVGPRERAISLLPPANHAVSEAQDRSATYALSPHRNGGTRVTHLVAVGTKIVLIIRDPLADDVAADLHRTTLTRNAGTAINIVETLTWHLRDPAPTVPECDVVAIVDGGLTPQETGWLDDLVGVLSQDHVLAAAPVLTVPSGVVFDAGVVRGVDGLCARSGRLDLAPFELARCRQVQTLSGRAMVIRRADFLVAAQSADGISRSLQNLATSTKKACLMWAHQRWALDVGLRPGPTDSPMLAWNQGRLKTWFEEDITPHQPEPGRIGEGVW
jgi:hypothetical protein